MNPIGMVGRCGKMSTRLNYNDKVIVNFFSKSVSNEQWQTMAKMEIAKFVMANESK